MRRRLKYLAAHRQVDALGSRLVSILAAPGCLTAANTAQRPLTVSARAVASLADECAPSCAERVVADGLFDFCPP